jgi:4-amino-4-deoxy-L-arabinose transferase-like glycosyltransferase
MSGRRHLGVLALVLALGVLINLWRLGATGVVDETPPLFAAAGRAMTQTGDWLTPRVNGLPRFDKPPLVYWLMALGYSLPGQSVWDPLGSWAARLPSALSSLAVMLVLADTVLRWPSAGLRRPVAAALTAALCFGLSPLVLVWSRTAVSDALLCGLLAISLMLQWRRFAAPERHRWWPAWLVLGLAVLAKGPVAVVLTGLTLLLFSALRRDLATPWSRLRPLPGLALTALVSLPWYAVELLVEGQPFWDSFFGYHNLQRFTSVVNDHLQPWWFFGPVMLVAAMPFSPLLLLGLARIPRQRTSPDQSLHQFAGCWLLAVLLLFTTAATKLPSYWLPATPAAALLICFALGRRDRWLALAWASSLALVLLLAVGFWCAPLWVPLINDPEMPTLASDLLASGLVWRAAGWFSLAALMGVVLWRWTPVVRLLSVQLSLVCFHLTAVIPIAELADQLRQLPVRQATQTLVDQQRPQEPLAMVGAMKPSVHFYAGQVILFEGRSDGALVNLADRLSKEQRRGWRGVPLTFPDASPTVLLIIDEGTRRQRHWRGLQPERLGRFGVYTVWRIERKRLNDRAAELMADGVDADWQKPRPERF